MFIDLATLVPAPEGSAARTYGQLDALGSEPTALDPSRALVLLRRRVCGPCGHAPCQGFTPVASGLRPRRGCLKLPKLLACVRMAVPFVLNGKSYRPRKSPDASSPSPRKIYLGDVTTFPIVWSKA